MWALFELQVLEAAFHLREEMSPFGVYIFIFDTPRLNHFGKTLRVEGPTFAGFPEGQGDEIGAAVGEGAEEIVHGSRSSEVGVWVPLEEREIIPGGGDLKLIRLAGGIDLVEGSRGGGLLYVIPDEVGQLRWI